MSDLAENRFVILHHQLPSAGQSDEHWDFMLEDGGELLTWAVEKRPEVGKQIIARRLENHRLKYLDYEGPISNKRGSVTQFLSGTYKWIERDENYIKIHLFASSDFDSIEISITDNNATFKFS